MHRRHLELKQKQKFIEAELKRDPAQSDRSISMKAKVSHTHVAKVRKEAEATGNVATVATSTDTLGRKQPRRRKPATKPSKPFDKLVDEVVDELQLVFDLLPDADLLRVAIVVMERILDRGIRDVSKKLVTDLRDVLIRREHTERHRAAKVTA